MTAKLNVSPKTAETADVKSAEILKSTQQNLGFVPNMYANMANSTTLLSSYIASYQSFRSDSNFTPVEQEVIFLSISFENTCDYCMAAHSFVADKMSKVPANIQEELRTGKEISDPRLALLSKFTKKMVEKRGWLDQADVDEFLQAGFEPKHVYDIVAAIGIKIMSNYSNHLYGTPLDEAFASYAWKKEA